MDLESASTTTSTLRDKLRRLDASTASRCEISSRLLEGLFGTTDMHLFRKRA